MSTYLFDYETFYSKEYSVKTLGNWMYTHHPEFDTYLLSVAGDDGFQWVGHPEDFDFLRFNGQICVAWNAGFENAVTERLIELKIIEPFKWNELIDAADLAAYLGYPRDLKQAALYMLDKDISKEARDKAKGRHWNEMDSTFQEELAAYGLNDSVIALEIWTKYNHLWPAWERELSRETREMCWRGLPTDKEKVKKAIISLDKRLINARALVPWVKDKPEAPVLSLKEAGMEARRHGIVPPKSFAKDSEEFEAWLEDHEQKFPWARALGEYRSVNMLQKKLITLRERTDEKGIFRYGLKYGGAHTLRDSGDAGFNPQNLTKEPMFGVDLRGCTINAPEGYTLAIVDESSIEPRSLAVLSGDEELVALLNGGQDIYEAQARISHGYKDSRPLKLVDPIQRQYMKVEVLACGYGAGPDKVKVIAKKQVGLELTDQEAEKIVKDFRKRKFIPDLWKFLEKECRKAAPGDWEMELPSGRVMHYRNVKSFGSLSGEIVRVNKLMRVKLWGGTLVENLAQATARDIFMWHILQCKKEDYPALLRAHDEGVFLVKEETAEQDLRNIISIFERRPPWFPNFPAAAEGSLSKVYKKI